MISEKKKINSKSFRSLLDPISTNVEWFEACNFPEYLKVIKEREEYHKFQYRSYSEFLNAGYLKENFKTIIVAVIDYFFSNEYERNGFKLSNYSRFCWQTVIPKENAIIHLLKNMGYTAEKLDLPARAAACKSGLGFIGKNCMFYGYDLGSYVGILMIGTDLDLKQENRGEEHVAGPVCRTCNKCIKACPMNAIYPEGYRINPFKCISFINRHIEEPHKEIPKDFLKLDNWLHGCEVCQDICPLNTKIKHKKEVVFLPEINLYGMKVPNANTVSKEVLIGELGNIKSLEYKKYVNKLLEGKKR